MIVVPPQPQVAFAFTSQGQVYDGVGYLAYEDGKAYAIPRPPIAGRFVIKLDKDRLERRHGILGLPYFVHTGDPIQL